VLSRKRRKYKVNAVYINQRKRTRTEDIPNMGDGGNRRREEQSDIA
jgi:hypothetical protein